MSSPSICYLLSLGQILSIFWTLWIGLFLIFYGSNLVLSMLMPSYLSENFILFEPYNLSKDEYYLDKKPRLADLKDVRFFSSCTLFTYSESQASSRLQLTSPATLGSRPGSSCTCRRRGRRGRSWWCSGSRCRPGKSRSQREQSLIITGQTGRTCRSFLTLLVTFSLIWVLPLHQDISGGGRAPTAWQRNS